MNQHNGNRNIGRKINMSNEVKAAISGAIIGGVIALIGLVFQYYTVSKPNLEVEKQRIRFEETRINNELQKIKLDLQNLQLTQQQFENLQKEKIIELLSENKFQPNIQFNNSCKNVGVFTFPDRKGNYTKISCVFTNRGRYSVKAIDAIKDSNIKEIRFIPKDQRTYVSGSAFSVDFYVQKTVETSNSQTQIVFATDPSFISQLEKWLRPDVVKQLNTRVYSIVYF